MSSETVSSSTTSSLRKEAAQPPTTSPQIPEKQLRIATTREPHAPPTNPIVREVDQQQQELLHGSSSAKSNTSGAPAGLSSASPSHSQSQTSTWARRNSSSAISSEQGMSVMTAATDVGSSSGVVVVTATSQSTPHRAPPPAPFSGSNRSPLVDDALAHSGSTGAGQQQHQSAFRATSTRRTSSAVQSKQPHDDEHASSISSGSGRTDDNANSSNDSGAKKKDGNSTSQHSTTFSVSGESAPNTTTAGATRTQRANSSSNSSSTLALSGLQEPQHPVVGPTSQTSPTNGSERSFDASEHFRSHSVSGASMPKVPGNNFSHSGISADEEQRRRSAALLSLTLGSMGASGASGTLGSSRSQSTDHHQSLSHRGQHDSLEDASNSMTEAYRSSSMDSEGTANIVVATRAEDGGRGGDSHVVDENVSEKKKADTVEKKAKKRHKKKERQRVALGGSVSLDGTGNFSSSSVSSATGGSTGSSGTRVSSSKIPKRKKKSFMVLDEEGSTRTDINSLISSPTGAGGYSTNDSSISSTRGTLNPLSKSPLVATTDGIEPPPGAHGGGHNAITDVGHEALDRNGDLPLPSVFDDHGSGTDSNSDVSSSASAAASRSKSEHGSHTSPSATAVGCTHHVSVVAAGSSSAPVNPASSGGSNSKITFAEGDDDFDGPPVRRQTAAADALPKLTKSRGSDSNLKKSGSFGSKKKSPSGSPTTVQVPHEIELVGDNKKRLECALEMIEPDQKGFCAVTDVCRIFFNAGMAKEEINVIFPEQNEADAMLDSQDDDENEDENENTVVLDDEQKIDSPTLMASCTENAAIEKRKRASGVGLIKSRLMVITHDGLRRRLAKAIVANPASFEFLDYVDLQETKEVGAARVALDLRLRIIKNKIQWADGFARRVFDCITMVSIVFFCLVSTYFNFILFSLEPQSIQWVFYFIHGIWLMDAICLALFPCRDKDTQRLLTSRKDIAHAKRVELILNAITIIPADLIICQQWLRTENHIVMDELKSDDTLTIIFLVLRILKQLKFLRIYTLFEIVNIDVIKPSTVDFFFLVKPLLHSFSTATVILHLSTVVFFHENDKMVPDREYITALAYTTSMLTGSGAGVDARGMDGVAVAIVLSCACILIQGVVIGKLAMLIFRSDVSSKNLAVMRETLEIVQHYRVPVHVQTEILSYQFHKLTDDVGIHMSNLATLPPQMLAEVLVFVKVDAISSVKLFQNAQKDCKTMLASNLESRICEPDVDIVTIGEFGDEMYTIAHGYANVIIVNGMNVATLSRGDYFGEIALLMENCTRQATVRALTFCDLWCLKKEDFLSVLDEYPSLLYAMMDELNAKKIDVSHLMGSVNKDGEDGMGERVIEPALVDMDSWTASDTDGYEDDSADHSLASRGTVMTGASGSHLGAPAGSGSGAPGPAGKLHATERRRISLTVQDNTISSSPPNSGTRNPQPPPVVVQLQHANPAAAGSPVRSMNNLFEIVPMGNHSASGATETSVTTTSESTTTANTTAAGSLASDCGEQQLSFHVSAPHQGEPTTSSGGGGVVGIVNTDNTPPATANPSFSSLVSATDPPSGHVFTVSKAKSPRPSQQQWTATGTSTANYNRGPGSTHNTGSPSTSLSSLNSDNTTSVLRLERKRSDQSLGMETGNGGGGSSSNASRSPRALKIIPPPPPQQRKVGEANKRWSALSTALGMKRKKAVKFGANKPKSFEESAHFSSGGGGASAASFHRTPSGMGTSRIGTGVNSLQGAMNDERPINVIEEALGVNDMVEHAVQDVLSRSQNRDEAARPLGVTGNPQQQLRLVSSMHSQSLSATETVTSGSYSSRGSHAAATNGGGAAGGSRPSLTSTTSTTSLPSVPRSVTSMKSAGSAGSRSQLNTSLKQHGSSGSISPRHLASSTRAAMNMITTNSRSSGSRSGSNTPSRASPHPQQQREQITPAYWSRSPLNAALNPGMAPMAGGLLDEPGGGLVTDNNSFSDLASSSVFGTLATSLRADAHHQEGHHPQQQMVPLSKVAEAIASGIQLYEEDRQREEENTIMVLQTKIQSLSELTMEIVGLMSQNSGDAEDEQQDVVAPVGVNNIGEVSNDNDHGEFSTTLPAPSPHEEENGFLERQETTAPPSSTSPPPQNS